MALARFPLRALGAAALVAAASSSVVWTDAHAQSGRLSLADRVARLEQQSQGGGQSTVDLLNRITELQAEVQALRGQIEQQNFKLQELEKRNRDQYIDLDGRLARIEADFAGQHTDGRKCYPHADKQLTGFCRSVAPLGGALV